MGDEDQDITMVELEDYRENQQKQDTLKARFNVNYVILGGGIGCLLGTLLGALQVNKLVAGKEINYEVATSTMWGLLLGTVVGTMVVVGAGLSAAVLSQAEQPLQSQL